MEQRSIMLDENCLNFIRDEIEEEKKNGYNLSLSDVIRSAILKIKKMKDEEKKAVENE